MFSRHFRPFAPGFRVDPQSDVPGFNLNDDSAWSARARPDDMPPGAPSPSYSTIAQNDIPGFNLRPEDTVPSFHLVEADGSSPFGDDSWLQGVPRVSTQRHPDAASLLAMPSLTGSNEYDPQGLPQWLYNLLTMPVPKVSTAVDPRTGQRIIPYQPLTRPVRAYPTTENSSHYAKDPGAYIDGTSSPPDPAPAQPPSAEQWPSFEAPTSLANFNADPHDTSASPVDSQAASAGSGGERLGMAPDGWPYARAGSGGLQAPAAIGPEPMGGASELPISSIADPNLSRECRRCQHRASAETESTVARSSKPTKRHRI